jgi:hypothetical protein
MAISDVAETAGTGIAFPAHPLLRAVLRYGVSAAGPVAVSGAHFLASLIFLHALSAREFGLFSFVMVVVSFGMSLNVSLISVAITRNLVTGEKETGPICFQMNWLVCGGFGGALFAALLLGHAPPREAAMLGLFGGVFAYRWFSRCFAFVGGHTGRAILSDLLYSLIIVGGLGALALLRRVSFTLGSEVLLAAALLALAPFGRRFFREQIAAIGRGNPLAYWPIFRELTRWSLLGVALTEITVNAHAYLVTFISGAGSFALLALGMLLMRPASLMQSALPDLERPVMARAIAARDWDGLHRIQRRFMAGLTAAWVGNMLLVAGILLFVPALVLKKGYALDQVVIVAVLSAVIWGVRTLRVPPSVLLQAAGQFRQLASIGTVSSVISVVATLALLLAFGPIASLGGILLGDLVILTRVRRMARDWKTANV